MAKKRRRRPKKRCRATTNIWRINLEQWIDEKVMLPWKYLTKGSKSPSPGSEKIPCKYSARNARSQPRFSNSADQGNITKQVFLQGKFVVIQKVKAGDNEYKNEQAQY